MFKKPIFKKFINPIVRGFVKQIPFVGAPVTELVTTLTEEKETPKHTKESQIAQWIVLALVAADLYFNKGANLKLLIDYLFSLVG